MLQLGLTRDEAGHTWLNGVAYVPVHVQRTDGYRVVASDEQADDDASAAAALVTTILGRWNARPFAAPLETTPDCP